MSARLSLGIMTVALIGCGSGGSVDSTTGGPPTPIRDASIDATPDAAPDAGAKDGGVHRDGFGGPLPPPTTQNYAIVSGASVLGTKTSYFITGTGGAFRLAATKDSGATELWGSVWTTGRFTQVMAGCGDQSCKLGPKDFVGGVKSVAGGEEIVFDLFPTSTVVGFDFIVDAQPVYFGLIVDDVKSPAAVLFPAVSAGGLPTAPSVMPFGLTVQ